MQANVALSNLAFVGELIPIIGVVFVVLGIILSIAQKTPMIFVQSLFFSLMCWAMPGMLGMMSDIVPAPESRPRTEMVKPDFISETVVPPSSNYNVEPTRESSSTPSAPSVVAAPSVVSNKVQADASAGVSASSTVKPVSVAAKPTAAKASTMEKTETSVNAEHKVIVVAPKQNPKPKVVDLNDEISGN